VPSQEGRLRDSTATLPKPPGQRVKTGNVYYLWIIYDESTLLLSSGRTSDTVRCRFALMAFCILSRWSMCVYLDGRSFCVVLSGDPIWNVCTIHNIVFDSNIPHDRLHATRRRWNFVHLIRISHIPLLFQYHNGRVADNRFGNSTYLHSLLYCGYHQDCKLRQFRRR